MCMNNFAFQSYTLTCLTCQSLLPYELYFKTSNFKAKVVDKPNISICFHIFVLILKTKLKNITNMSNVYHNYISNNQYIKHL